MDRGDIVIIGAGLVGSLLAYLLQKRGFTVTVFERYSDIRRIPSLGRSINLVITRRGLRAVDSIGGGLREELLSLAVRVTGRVIHQSDGSVQYQRYGKDDNECNYSISRYELNKFLIEKAESAGAKIHFAHELDSEGTLFAEEGGDVKSSLKFKIVTDGVVTYKVVDCRCPVIACDGGGSRARYAMRKDHLLEFTESLLGTENGGPPHSYKEILFPADCGLVPHGLHIWPRRNHMLMALANLDGSMTGTLYMDTHGSESFATITTNETATEFFEKYYPEAIPMIGGIQRARDQMLLNPSGLLGTVRTTKWNYKGRVVLIGDAAHAIVPFFGQGMNCGFEDVLQLLIVIDQYRCEGGRLGSITTTVDGTETVESEGSVGDISTEQASAWATAFEEFNTARKANGDAIAQLAVENFHEMRDRVADRRFLLQKRVENRLEKAFAHKFRSGYAMVCYGGSGPGEVTYAMALHLSRVQNEILGGLIDSLATELEGLPADVDWSSLLDEYANRVSIEEGERLIDEKVVPLQIEYGIDLSTVIA